jgi:hypothetical protein
LIDASGAQSFVLIGNQAECDLLDHHVATTMNSLARALNFFIAGIALLALVGEAVAADEAAKKVYPLPGHGGLALQVPANWKDSVKQPVADEPPTLDFAPAQGKAFIVTLLPSWRTRADQPLPDKAELRKQVEYSGSGMLPHAIEQDIKIVELEGAEGPGYYFSVTDNAPKPDGYKFMTQGRARVGDLMIVFTILTNEGQEGVLRDALKMVSTAAHVRP